MEDQQNQYTERQALADMLMEQFPALELHSSGCGTGGFDLGFHLEGQADTTRSLELWGDGGLVKAHIAENYGMSKSDGYSRRKDFGEHEFDGKTLPPHVIRAARHFTNPTEGTVA